MRLRIFEAIEPHETGRRFCEFDTIHVQEVYEKVRRPEFGPTPYGTEYRIEAKFGGLAVVPEGGNGDWLSMAVDNTRRRVADEALHPLRRELIMLNRDMHGRDIQSCLMRVDRILKLVDGQEVEDE